MAEETKKTNTGIGNVKPREITEEMRDSYIDYAMSVIISRALPDVRDGLKPVHRRILYAMHEMGLGSSAKSRKSAAVTGEVLGKYHPHGDMAVYDAAARMAQDFSMRYPLITGQGNMGCFTADTKVKLADGRNLSFLELVEEHRQGRKNFTFTVEQGKIKISEIENPRITKKSAEIMRVVLDNGEEIKCTLNHRFLLRNGVYKKAEDLGINDSLMPIYSRFSTKEDNPNAGGWDLALEKYYNNNSNSIFAEINGNHKVAKKEFLEERADVYDLTVAKTHNFSLSAGVFVHNSIDGDPPAAQRYTEMKLSKIGEEMLKEIEKDTVNFMDNYDGTRKEPVVLPSPMPQLILNGTLGIAVGMATNIPPHNLSETCDALTHIIDHPKADTEDIFEFIKGPDFPTGGVIFGKKDIISAYSQGKGPIMLRGKAEVKEEEKSGRSQIIISEIPFQVQKSSLVEQFANLVQEKKIEGIKDIRDESDKEGMRIVIDLHKEAYPQKILNRLYKFSDLQKPFHLNMLSLVDGIQPRVLSLAEILIYFVEHRKEVVFRRTKYELEKAKERAHILEGLQKCLSNIDAVIRIIKASKNREEAQKNLMKRFKLTEVQANAILETKLAALAKLEREKIEQELKDLMEKIRGYAAILKSPQKIKDVIKKEIKELKEKFGDERKTKVFVQQIGEIAEEDLIPQEETMITLTQGGYIKRINPATYKIQRRGGKGIMGMKTMQEDIVEHFLVAETHDSLFFFTDSGKVFRTVVYEIPEGTRVARGRGLLNFLEITPQDKVLSLMTLDKKDTALGIKNLVMITENGIIKKSPLEDFKNVRKSGLIAIKLKKGDLLKKVVETTGGDELIIVTEKGQSIRFNEKQIREMGRTASGVRGIRLKAGDKVVGMEVIGSQKNKSQNLEEKDKKEAKGPAQRYLLVVMDHGYGKRTDVKEYRAQGRGGSGIKTANVTPKTGKLIFSKVLNDEEDLIVISQKGQVIRTEVNSIAKLSRSTQGVRIMRLDEGDKVASAACI